MTFYHLFFSLDIIHQLDNHFQRLIYSITTWACYLLSVLTVMLFTLTVKSLLPQELIIQSLACAVCKDRSNYLLFNLLLEFLRNYLTGDDYSSREFRNNIQQYNAAFAMTSVVVKIDNSVTRQSGPYCFKIQGELHHLTGALLPHGDQTPIYAQIYILDTAEQLNCYESPKKEKVSHTFKHLIANIKSYNEDKI